MGGGTVGEGFVFVTVGGAVVTNAEHFTVSVETKTAKIVSAIVGK